MLNITNPPLISFRIDFNFDKLEDITFSKMAEVENFLKNYYQQYSNFQIIEYPVQTGIPFPIGPIKFISKDNDRQLQLFANGIIFIYTRYTHWEDIKVDIVDILIKICELLEIKTIEEYRFEYIDEFNFIKEDFNLNEYFALNINFPQIWNINYTDFHTGINLNVKNSDKFIIRLRGLPPSQQDKYLFRLESIYVKKITFRLNDRDTIIKNLDYIHDIIIDYFKNILTNKLKSKLGVKEDD
jgi:uncharacterized protein (TIGR04255 family)